MNSLFFSSFHSIAGGTSVHRGQICSKARNFNVTFGSIPCLSVVVNLEVSASIHIRSATLGAGLADVLGCQKNTSWSFRAQAFGV